MPPVRPHQEHPHVHPRRRRAQRAHPRVLRATKGPRGPGPINRSETTSQKTSSSRHPGPVGAAGARGSHRSRVAVTASRARPGRHKKNQLHPYFVAGTLPEPGRDTSKNHDHVTPAWLAGTRPPTSVNPVAHFGENFRVRPSGFEPETCGLRVGGRGVRGVRLSL